MTGWQKVLLWSVAIIFGLPVVAFLVFVMFLGLFAKSLIN